MISVRIATIALLLAILITPCFAADWTKTYDIGSVSGSNKVDIKFVPGDDCVLNLDSTKYSNGNYIAWGSVKVFFNAYDEKDKLIGQYALLDGGIQGTIIDKEQSVTLPLKGALSEKKIAYYKPEVSINMSQFDRNNLNITGKLTVSLTKIGQGNTSGNNSQNGTSGGKGEWSKTYDIGEVHGDSKVSLNFAPGEKCYLSLEGTTYSDGNYIPWGGVDVNFLAYDDKGNFIGKYKMVTASIQGTHWNGQDYELPLKGAMSDKKISYYKTEITLSVSPFNRDSKEVGKLTVYVSKEGYHNGKSSATNATTTATPTPTKQPPTIPTPLQPTVNTPTAKDWIYEGSILWEQKKYEEAIACFDKALEINPDNEDAKNWKQNVMIDMEEQKEGEFCRKVAFGTWTYESSNVSSSLTISEGRMEEIYRDEKGEKRWVIEGPWHIDLIGTVEEPKYMQILFTNGCKGTEVKYGVTEDIDGNNPKHSCQILKEEGGWRLNGWFYNMNYINKQ